MAFVLTIAGVLLIVDIYKEFFVYDHTPPVSAIVQTPETAYVTSNHRVFRYRAVYNKRDDCSVLKGHYEIHGQTLEGSEFALRPFRVVTSGTWPPGVAQEAQSSLVVPNDVPPGIYQMVWEYVYRCETARRPLIVRSPPMEVRVRG